MLFLPLCRLSSKSFCPGLITKQHSLTNIMIYVTWHHLTVPKTPVGLMASPTLLLFILRELRFCIRHRNIRYDAYTIRTNYTFRIWLLFFEFFMFPWQKFSFCHMYAPQYFTLQRLQEILLWSYLEGVLIIIISFLFSRHVLMIFKR